MATKIVSAPLTRPLSEVAAEIVADYAGKGQPVYYSAAPYVKAMLYLDGMDDHYFHDSADDVVMYALSNLTTWRGPVATRVRAELKGALEHHRQGTRRR